MKKILYKIEWYDVTPDKDGNRIHQETTIRRESLQEAISAVCSFFEIPESEITLITKLEN